MDSNGKSQNPNQEIKDTVVEVFKQTPFTALQTDVLKFNSLEDENAYFDNLPKAYRGTTHAFNKDKDNIVLKGKVQDYEHSNYLRYNNDGKWYYAFITGVEYINHSTVNIHYVIDYFNTYQCDINWDIVQSNVEQSHLKRRTTTGDLNIVKVNQGFDTGIKEIRGTEVYNPEVLFIVLVCKPSIELPGLNAETIRNVGMYKPFVYLIIPVDRYMTYTYPYKVGGNFNKGKAPVKDVLKTLTNTFSDNANTINNVVNMYSTKDIGVDYTLHDGYIEFSNTQVDFIPFGESEEGVNGITPIDTTNTNEFYNNECPISLFNRTEPNIISYIGVKIDPITLEDVIETRTFVKGIESDNSVKSVKTGKVVEVSYSDNFKNYVIIQSSVKTRLSDASMKDEYIMYSNLSSVNVYQNRQVKQGEKIGEYDFEKGVGFEVRLGGRDFGNSSNIITTEDDKLDLSKSTLIDPIPWYTNCIVNKESELAGSDKLVEISLHFQTPRADRQLLLKPEELIPIINKCKKFNVKNIHNILELSAITGVWGTVNPLNEYHNQCGIFYLGDYFSPSVNLSDREQGALVNEQDPRYANLRWVKYKRDLSLADSFEDFLYALNQYTDALQAESLHSFCEALTDENRALKYPVLNILTSPLPSESGTIQFLNYEDLEILMNNLHSQLLNKYGEQYQIIREL